MIVNAGVRVAGMKRPVRRRRFGKTVLELWCLDSDGTSREHRRAR